MEGLNAKSFVDVLSDQNKEFVIVGLTGRVRSGTSDVAKLLASINFNDSATQPANTEDCEMSEVRELKLIYRYLHHQWKPFIELSVISVIVSFLLDEGVEELKRCNLKDADDKNVYLSPLLSMCLESEEFKNKVMLKMELINNAIKLHIKSNAMRSNILGETENIVGEIKDIGALISKWKIIKNNIIEKVYSADNIIFCYGVLPVLAEYIEETLGKDKNFTSIFQEFGNNIRAYGKAIYSCGVLDSKNLFVLPERLNQFIKILRHYSANERPVNPIFIVINNFKNIFEAFYFRRRYSSFYLLAVSCDEKYRKTRFADMKTYGLADLRENLASAKRLYKIMNGYFEKSPTKEKELMENVECDSSNSTHELTRKIAKELGIGDIEMEFCMDIFFASTLRRECYNKNLAPFILQDVMTCIENADIFVTRNYKEGDYKCDYPLIRSLARFATLVLHPGLLTPTKIERCMQIAMTAKLNSGCLSRQVGAVVTDKEYNILSLGWNDAPCGVESCIRRNLFDLLRKHDPEAYSEYELHDEVFRSYMDKIDIELKENNKKSSLKGLPGAFCFKDVYQDIIKQRDQIYTRSLHGEERALATCGNDRAKGGYLFTTSSPCELCAKKAKEASIDRIYYIEKYPGISHTHVIEAGPKEKRAEYEYFVGAVGLAYVKLYTPLMPYKDELATFGFTPSHILEKMNIKESQGKNNDNDVVEKIGVQNGQERQVQQL